MNARLGDRVDLLDRPGQLGLARLAQALALHGTAHAHRQLVEDGITAWCRLGQALPGEQDARARIIILTDGQGTGRLVDPAGDIGLRKRGGD